jgi:hypothetical protein
MRTHLLALLAASTAVAAAAADPGSLRPWTEYRVILWTGDTAWKQPDKRPLFFQRLQELGATHGMVHGHGEAGPWLDAGVPYYLENMVNRGLCLKWNSPVRDWDAFVTAWSKARGWAEFVRPYDLHDPKWREWARSEVRTLVARHAANAPLACDLRDELSVTLSANPFDYDFGAATIAAFRAWLKREYSGTHPLPLQGGERVPSGSPPPEGWPKAGVGPSPSGAADALRNLNAAWDTAFTTWDAVLPFTTDEIKNRMASACAGCASCRPPGSARGSSPRSRSKPGRCRPGPGSRPPRARRGLLRPTSPGRPCSSPAPSP